LRQHYHGKPTSYPGYTKAETWIYALVPYITLTEANANFSVQAINLQKGQQNSVDYLRLNPKHKVPLLLAYRERAIQIWIAHNFPKVCRSSLPMRRLFKQILVDRRLASPMRILRRRFLSLVTGAAALPSFMSPLWADTYPTRPVRIIINDAPGGLPDVAARHVLQRKT
jgi:hypothetical protein